MKKQFKYPMNYTAIRIAIISFVLGTICLLLFKTNDDTGFVGIGYFYTLFAAFVNAVVLLLVIFHGIRRYKEYTEHLITIVIILANIPITLLYLNLL
jgi:hypothetical protein